MLQICSLVPGQHLSAFRDMLSLKSLRLRGFDLSEGIEHLCSLTKLEHLHLCHGNTCSMSERTIPHDAFLSLYSLEKLKTIHIENMDNMTLPQIRPLCQFEEVTSLTFKHCQELSSNTLSSISTISSLQELHFINSPTDEFEPFESEDLVQLKNLKQCKTLSFLFVLIDMFDILDLEGMVSLETLNVGFHTEVTKKEFDILCLALLPVIPNLKKVQIYCIDEKSLKNFIQAIFNERPEHVDMAELTVGNWKIDVKVYGCEDFD